MFLTFFDNFVQNVNDCTQYSFTLLTNIKKLIIFDIKFFKMVTNCKSSTIQNKTSLQKSEEVIIACIYSSCASFYHLIHFNTNRKIKL